MSICISFYVGPTLFPEKVPYDPEEIALKAINGIPPMIDVNRQIPPPLTLDNNVNTKSSIDLGNMLPGNNNRRPDPIQPLQNMHEICRRNEGLLLSDPTNCARYYNCSRYAVKYEGFQLNQDECPYPQLFSVNTGFCEDFPDVNCESRYVPKAPCMYIISPFT